MFGHCLFRQRTTGHVPTRDPITVVLYHRAVDVCGRSQQVSASSSTASLATTWTLPTPAHPIPPALTTAMQSTRPRQRFTSDPCSLPRRSSLPCSVLANLRPKLPNHYLLSYVDHPDYHRLHLPCPSITTKMNPNRRKKTVAHR